MCFGFFNGILNGFLAFYPLVTKHEYGKSPFEEDSITELNNWPCAMTRYQTTRGYSSFLGFYGILIINKSQFWNGTVSANSGRQSSSDPALENGHVLGEMPYFQTNPDRRRFPVNICVPIFGVLQIGMRHEKLLVFSVHPKLSCLKANGWDTKTEESQSKTADTLW